MARRAGVTEAFDTDQYHGDLDLIIPGNECAVKDLC